ncbi:MAG: hypothetical protein GXY80_11270 [Syntrophorhabdus aromaticivorans]|uniref:Uncharacterized protein n=1 Tax=Syntrophorhabdus aromaticivorans TaxID=328301 RepID=A0A971M4Q7_9BACT|nr:hypothetical protein [Syntrophorhabdus aromaticivorans]
MKTGLSGEGEEKTGFKQAFIFLPPAWGEMSGTGGKGETGGKSGKSGKSEKGGTGGMGETGGTGEKKHFYTDKSG